jgi:hypothetical protein
MKLSSRVARWTPEEDELLRKLVLANASPFDIAVQLERSRSSVRARGIGWAYRSVSFSSHAPTCRAGAEGENPNDQTEGTRRATRCRRSRSKGSQSASRQTISDSQAEPEFQENHKRLKADRLAREAGLKAKGK